MQVQESAVSVKTSSQLGGSSQLGESGSQGGSSQLGGIFQQPPAGQKRHVYLDTRHPKYGIRLEVCVTKNACSWRNLYLMSLIALTRRISHTVEIKRTFSVWFHYLPFTPVPFRVCVRSLVTISFSLSCQAHRKGPEMGVFRCSRTVVRSS